MKCINGGTLPELGASFNDHSEATAGIKCSGLGNPVSSGESTGFVDALVSREFPSMILAANCHC